MVYKKLKQISNIIKIISEALSSSALVIIATTMVIQVVLRFLFKQGLPWVEEICRYLIIWMVMLTGGNLIKDKQLIKVDFFDYLWPEKAIKLRDLCYRIILIVVLIILIKVGWTQAWSARNSRIISLDISWFWPYLAIPLGSALMFLQYIFLFIEDVINFKKK